MKNIWKIKIITKDTEDNTDIQIYKEFIALMKDILIEIKRDGADKWSKVKMAKILDFYIILVDK